MQRLSNWLVDAALPFWATRGFDEASQHFHERLAPCTRPLAVPYRAMVQARQIYVYAQAARLGWHPKGGARAEAAMAGLRRDYLQTSGSRASVVFSIDPSTGNAISTVRDTYTHAFVLFAIAQLYALGGDAKLLKLADAIIAFVEHELTDPVHGGLFDASPRTGAKRQNPHMHLLEALLALHSVAPGRGYIDHADRLVRLFYDRLAHHGHDAIFEHFADDWGPHPDVALAEIFEPGHHYEWIWLLHHHERLSGADHSTWRKRLDRTARTSGHAEHGMIWDEVAPGGRITKRSFRLWPHTEAIKSATVGHSEDDPIAEPFAKRMSNLLFAHFLDRPFQGGWTDHLTDALEPIVDYVPASSLYHLMHAAVEANATFAVRSGMTVPSLVRA